MSCVLQLEDYCLGLVYNSDDSLASIFLSSACYSDHNLEYLLNLVYCSNDRVSSEVCQYSVLQLGWQLKVIL